MKTGDDYIMAEENLNENKSNEVHNHYNELPSISIQSAKTLKGGVLSRFEIKVSSFDLQHCVDGLAWAVENIKPIVEDPSAEVDDDVDSFKKPDMFG